MRIVNAAADDRIDVDMEVSVFGQQLQFLVKHLQRLLRNVVRHHVVDTDLKMVETARLRRLIRSAVSRYRW